MDDKQLMQNVLLLEKGACDLYLHATIESSTPKVHEAFCSSLNSALAMQDDIYDHMASKGWYSTEQAEQEKIGSVKQKYTMR